MKKCVEIIVKPYLVKMRIIFSAKKMFSQYESSGLKVAFTTYFKYILLAVLKKVSLSKKRKGESYDNWEI